MLVYKQHVKYVIKALEVPHVKKVQYSECPCSFCNNNATVEIFYSLPFSNTRKKLKKHEVMSG